MKARTVLGNVVLGIGAVLAVGVFASTNPQETEATTLYRAYNPTSGEHLFTTNTIEIPYISQFGWRDEGTAWAVPSSGEPVYRMLNPNTADHHYTLSASERDNLKIKGWRYEGVAWYSGGKTEVFRMYNPNARTGTHHFTTDGNECDYLVRKGWKYEGVGFYSGTDEKPVEPEKPVTPTPVDPIGNSGILEKDLKVAGEKAEEIHNDPNSDYYYAWFAVHEPENDVPKGYAYASRQVKMSNGEYWYTIDFYVDYL
ncbi:hypothetical protein [Enterococcus sp. AZ103]|uniref:hypothetical protein n=1 Tax=Enterococcus sp. AZ103 TaxID=2774628 RepID=UPI003F22B91E